MYSTVHVCASARVCGLYFFQKPMESVCLHVGCGLFGVLRLVNILAKSNFPALRQRCVRNAESLKQSAKSEGREHDSERIFSSSLGDDSGVESGTVWPGVWQTDRWLKIVAGLCFQHLCTRAHETSYRTGAKCYQGCFSERLEEVLLRFFLVFLFATGFVFVSFVSVLHCFLCVLFSQSDTGRNRAWAQKGKVFHFSFPFYGSLKAENFSRQHTLERTLS